jgi:hypothetical protein
VVEQSRMGGEGEHGAEGDTAVRSPPPAPLFDLAAGALGGSRWFMQKEPSTGETRPYRANGIAGIALSAEARVAVFSPILWWTLEGDYWGAIGLTSYGLREKMAVGTTSSRLNAMARVHVKTGQTAHALEAVVECGLGRWTYEPQVAAAPDLENPTGDYTFLRAGLGIHVPFRPFELSAGGAIASAFDAGPLGNRTVSTRPWSVDGWVGAGLSIGPYFGVQALASYTLFSYQLLPLEGLGELPALVTDAYFTLGLAAHVRF